MSELQQQQQQQPQQQQQQQPAFVYPNTAATVGSQPPPSHHSNGSFGAVFIVLAVIVVISALACFLGRLCNRRVENGQRPKPEKTHSGARPRGKEPKLHPDKEGDIEFGFDLRNPNGNKGKFPSSGGNGGSKGKSNGNGNGTNGPNGHGNSFKPFENGGETRSEIKHTDHHEGDFNFKAAGHHV
ncbi:uncharacterized protein LOC120081701 [Benincasa hispida]|uniref:uncharacterized protein LOC120081701 n=1 Tax=Benincasa hispida TaxID=102211 RepID=UPI0019004520|nr:uncharacterized protein LOC120081701 [Benincasa hispida]